MKREELQKQLKTSIKMAISMFLSIIKCKWTKCFSQKT